MITVQSAVASIAVICALGVWCAVHVVLPLDLDGLPARSRRRVQFCQGNARWLYLCCGALAVAASAPQLLG